MSFFLFVVHRLRWIARVPLMPHLFDGALLAITCVFHRPRLALMESLEREATRLPGVRLGVHRFGGMEFGFVSGGELGHMHGNGLVDVRLRKETARTLVDAGTVRRHHVLPDSSWVSLLLVSRRDVSIAIELLKMARAGRVAGPGIQKLPVVGVEPTLRFREKGF